MAILRTQKTPVASKQDQQQKVAQKLETAIGRPAATAKEKRLRAGTAAVMSGTMNFADVQRLYAVSQEEIKRFISQVFPTDGDKYEFLEECMLANAILASSRFQQCFGELNAIDAARAAAIFAGKATDIRKAREAGFKETPISVTTIVALEKTLRNLAQPPVDLALQNG